MQAAAPRTVLQIYAGAVCFASVGCLAISIGIAAYSTVAVFNPSFTASSSVGPMYEPPPFVIPQVSADGMRIPSGALPATAQLSGEELAVRRARMAEAAVEFELRAAKQSLLRWCIAALISALLFAAHWRILRKEIPRALALTTDR